MPHTDGEFAPYFKNVTEALMFCWIQKHNICKEIFNDFLPSFSLLINFCFIIILIATRAYDELVDIINHPKFKSEDVVTNFASTPDQITQSSYFKQKNPINL